MKNVIGFRPRRMKAIHPNRARRRRLIRCVKIERRPITFGVRQDARICVNLYRNVNVSKLLQQFRLFAQLVRDDSTRMIRLSRNNAMVKHDRLPVNVNSNSIPTRRDLLHG